jgi:membrane protein DedA with SNARE-associated domain
MSKLEFTVFAPFTYAGAFLWSFFFVLAGYFLGKEWTQVSEKIRPALLIASVIFLVLLTGYFLIQQRKHRGQK